MAGRKRTRHGKTCGAKTRKGGPCKCRLLLVKGKPDPAGRCKFHGGMSTGAKALKPGPKTEAGKARSYAARDAGRARRWERHRNASNASNAEVTTAALPISRLASLATPLPHLSQE